MSNPIHDLVIVGAGISGIGTAYWLQQKCPDKNFVILEARDSIGGTWSLFKYPGIRSDSDMFTFGYRFKPWTSPQSISSGENILQYLKETVRESGIDKHIRFGHKMISANWSDESKSWTLKINSSKGEDEIACRFLSICTGYYDYKEAHRPRFEGEADFKGKIVVPQFWPKDLDYTYKKIAVVGSGATAVTIVPSMVEKGAKHVTMVQRSPTYIMNLPNRNGMFIGLNKVLPSKWAYKLTRWKNISLQMFSFGMARLFPKMMKGLLMKAAARELPENYPIDKHFNPRYNPWEQRLCVVPDGDLFQTIKEGKASVNTGEIGRFTETGIEMEDGDKVEADIIVLATGLKMQLLGGANIYINGKQALFKDAMIYKGMMVSDLPNFIYAFGYTNASWTLKVDLTANYLCKLLNYMDKKGFDVVVPQRENLESDEDFLNLSSGYIQRAKKILPRQGKRRPWKVYQNYLVDMLATRFGRIRDSVLKFQ